MYLTPSDPHERLMCVLWGLWLVDLVAFTLLVLT
jgi:hypothetical protein